jgi:hypothetical protein
VWHSRRCTVQGTARAPRTSPDGLRAILGAETPGGSRALGPALKLGSVKPVRIRHRLAVTPPPLNLENYAQRVKLERHIVT